MLARVFCPSCLIVLAACAASAPARLSPSTSKSVRPAPSASSVARPADGESSPDARIAAATDAGDPTRSELAAVPDASTGPADMLPVPGGEFIMGADGIGERDEQPAHRVTIRGFLLDTHEVTNRSYEECMRVAVCKPYRREAAADMKLGPDERFRGPEQPVVGVSWYDATAYCAWRGKRLPSEAEWEKAARGTDARTYPWGEAEPDPQRLACFSGSRGGTTLPVGSFPSGKGPYGHLDLTGNVWEWTSDLYDPYAYKRSTAAAGVPGSCEEIVKSQDALRAHHQQGYTGKNPIPVDCERVLRGGAFNYNARGLRASNRVHHAPNFRIVVAGFRCAKDTR
jgi:formylglycine-generating enzyme required for sulfatase activity